MPVHNGRQIRLPKIRRIEFAARSSMKTLRNTLLGACLALPLAATAGHAQTIEQGGRIIQVPPGAVVIILPGPGAVAAPATTNAVAPSAMPMMQLIAQQQAMMQRMIANMNAMMRPMPMPDPSQLLRAAFGNGGPMFTLAAGPGVCSESISIVQRGNSAPVVTHTRTGACGAPAGSLPQGVRQLPATPIAPPHGPRLIEASNPPHIVPNLPPHT
jgi:hypothetical protein